MDFTFSQYECLLKTLQGQGFLSITFLDYVNHRTVSQNASTSPLIILRHDVEQHYEKALRFAQIENDLRIKGTYYFRILKNHFDAGVVKQIADLGHETGYHYDDLARCKGDYPKAIARFEKNLQTLRKIAPVQTISMDRSPLSKNDNKKLWKKYDYRDLGIIGEPYFDMDFDKVFYLTDTGRRWDGWKVSVRDKVPQHEKWNKQGLIYHTTNDIIRAVEAGRFPKQVMFTFHPQRWNDKPVPWVKELVWQRVKNVGKRFLVMK